MKKTVLFLFLILRFCAGAQPLQEYFFNNNFNGTAGGGTLTEVLSCGAGLGSFGTQSITTTSGFCSNSTAFCFNDGGGLSYPNTSITSQYSINLFCKFNALSGYTRIIDFSNGASDNGIYLLNNCLVLYPNGTIGPCPYFNPNLYYLFTFVRDASTNTISVYVNGTFFSSYVDATNLYRPATSSTPIIFFRDDVAVPCESAPGCVRYASISSSTLSPAQVNTVWVNICNTVSSCTAVAGSNYSVCPGQTATLGGSPTAVGGSGTFTYTWTPAAGLNNATIANPVATPSVQTTYTVTIDDGAGCVRSDTVKVFMNPLPTVTVSPGTSVCSGASATLSAGGAATYTWSPATGLSAVNGASVTASPAATTIYTVAGTSTSGCVNSATVQVTAAGTPTITASPNATICPAGSASLTASGAVSYTWSPAAGLSAANGATVTASPVASTVYTVTGTNATGCTASATVQVTTAGNPTITASPDATICPTGSVSLTASGAVTYTWSPAAGLSATNGASVTATPAATTIYTVIGTNASGCIANATVQVTVAGNPTITTSSNATICPAGSASLTAAGAVSYTWSPAAGLSSANGASVTATPAATTIYTVTGTSAAGCIGSATVQVSAGSNPTITASPNATVCPAGSASLTAGGAVSYTWSPAAGLSSANGASVTATPAATTIYTVTGTGATGCTGSNTVSVLVAGSPTITVVNGTLCASSSATLSASGATSYTWSPSGSLSSANGASVIATPFATTSYTVTGSSGACTGTAVATASVISVNPLIAASSASYCIGGTAVALTASGATSYTWSPPVGLSATSGATVSASPSVSTTYTLSGSMSSCIGTQTISITVPPVSSLSIVAGSTLICANGSGTALNGSGASTYTWLPGAQTTSTIQVNPPATASYTLTGQTPAGCATFPAVITISVSPAINATLTASSPSVCLGKTETISVQPAGGAYTYTWLPVSAIQGSNAGASITAKPGSTTTVVYTVTISNGLCKETHTVSLQVFDCVPPVSQFATLTNDSICTKACVSFTATSTGIQPLTYQWLFPGGTPATSGSPDPVVCYPAAGAYPVTLITGNPFGNDTLMITDYIHVADTPSVKAFRDTTISIGQAAQIRAVGNGTWYQWLPDNGTIACATCTSTVVQPTVTTQYTVTAYNSPYCKRQSSILVKVDFVCGDFFIPNAFSPNGDGLNDEVNIHGFCIASYTLKIFNRWGEKVFETSDKNLGWDGTFRGKPMDTGVFVYTVDGMTIENKPFTKKGNITLMR